MFPPWLQGAAGAASVLLLAVGGGQTAKESELPPPLPVEGAEAASEAQMRPYTEHLDQGVTFDMVPIRGGSFSMGSAADDASGRDDERPRRSVSVSPFWIGRHEVSWNEYHLFMLELDIDRRQGEPSLHDRYADAVTRPTPPYVPMDFGMGVDGYPAIGMTQFAARQYTRWLSMKTGRFYRLASEAEWEHACRSGEAISASSTAEPDRLGDIAWYADNSAGSYHPIGTRRANRLGVLDLLGNVAEWVLDEYRPAYEASRTPLVDPVTWPQRLYPRVVRGGSWRDPPQEVRCAARRGSSPEWKRRDPQLPQSIWYHTSADFVGLRVVRPLAEPSPELLRRAWEADVDEVREVLSEQPGQSR